MKTGFDFPGFDTVKAVPEATGGGQGVDEKNFVCGRNSARPFHHERLQKG